MRGFKLIGVLLLAIMVLTVTSIPIYSKKLSKTSAVIEVESLTDKEFAKLVKEGKAEGVSKADLKKLCVKVSVKWLLRTKDATIGIPHLDEYINNYDKVRSIKVETPEAQYIRFASLDFYSSFYSYVIFDARGLNEEQIRNLFTDAYATSAWTTRKGEVVENKFNIRELMRFR